jgi:hypothetical protein
MTTASLSHVEPLVDARSPLHAIIGFAAGVMGVDPHLAMVAFVGARIVEQAFDEGTEHAVYAREEGHSLGNELTDLMFEIVGLHLGEKLRERLLEQHEPNATHAAGIGQLSFPPAMIRYHQANGVYL